jgi:hypothetical protein
VHAAAPSAHGGARVASPLGMTLAVIGFCRNAFTGRGAVAIVTTSSPHRHSMVNSTGGADPPSFFGGSGSNRVGLRRKSGFYPTITYCRSRATQAPFLTMYAST